MHFVYMFYGLLACLMIGIVAILTVIVFIYLIGVYSLWIIYEIRIRIKGSR